MTYSITARREKARFRCSDLDLEGAEFWKRKLERDGWAAIIIRDCAKPQKAPQNALDASEIMAGIDEHKQARNAIDTRFPWFLATCMLVAIALVGYLIYLAAFAFPAFGAGSQKIGWFLMVVGLTTAFLSTWKGISK